MARPEDVELRGEDETEQMFREIVEQQQQSGEEGTDTATGQGTEPEAVEVEEPSTSTEDTGGGSDVSQETLQRGRNFIRQMIDGGNQVMANTFGEPAVEVIVPRDVDEEVHELIESWNLNPNVRDVMKLPPSFEDDRPDVAEGLTSFQFYLDDDSDLESTEYDLETIVESLNDDPDVPLLLTKSNRVKTPLPLED